MNKLFVFAVFLFLPLCLHSQELIEKLEIVGNDRVSPETVNYYIATREGDYY